MHCAYVEEPDASRSKREGWLILRRRFYFWDFVGSAMFGWVPLAALAISVWESSLIRGLIVASAVGIPLSAAAIISVARSYKLVEIPAPESMESIRSAAVAAFEELSWTIHHDNQKYLSGFHRPNTIAALVLIVIYDRDRVWFSCRGADVGRFGRIPFRGGPNSKAVRAFHAQFIKRLRAAA